MNDLAALERLLDLLRDKGVIRYKAADLELDLMPHVALPKMPELPPTPRPPSGEDDLQRWADEIEGQLVHGAS